MIFIIKFKSFAVTHCQSTLGMLFIMLTCLLASPPRKDCEEGYTYISLL